MKKYLIYLMMAAAIVTFGACSPEDEHEPQTPDIENPEKPDDGGEDTPDNPNNPEIPMTRINPATIPTRRMETARFWSPISVGAARRSAWRRKSSVRPEPICFASSR